ncbi:HupE/UreJ family protein [Ectothiorhodospiraceae bacterium WFHF3C12]|nr:HupE/UreJ family protein [Ectothiorhodospiraceae bacterium WFHF3C12]
MRSTSSVARTIWLALVLLVAVFGRAEAHPSGVTATDVYLGRDRVELVYTVPVDELWRVVGGEQPDAAPPPGEYAKAVRQGFAVENGGAPCTLFARDAAVLDDIGSYEYRLRYRCPRPLETLRIDYGLFVGFDRAHRNLTRVYAGDQGLRAVLHHGRDSLDIPVAQLRAQPDFELPSLPARPEPPGSETPDADTFLVLGLEHIVTGYDHLLFLAGLILVTLRFSAIAVLVTAFTVAHSITLGLATLGYIAVPAALTESLIALSVSWVAVANVVAVLRQVPPAALRAGRSTAAFDAAVYGIRRARWFLTFLFGLIHGVGFAGMLREIGLPEEATVTALALFNVGVEVGQLAAVALAFPVLRLLARQRGYPVLVLGLSAALAVVGLVWFAERAGWV